MGKAKEQYGEDPGKAGVLPPSRRFKQIGGPGQVWSGGEQPGDFPGGEITPGSPGDRKLFHGKRS